MIFYAYKLYLHHSNYITDQQILILLAELLDSICYSVCIMMNDEGTVALLWGLKMFVCFQILGLNQPFQVHSIISDQAN